MDAARMVPHHDIAVLVDHVVVVAHPADHDIGARAAIERVVAAAAEQAVVAVATAQAVVIVAADQRVVAAQARQHVVARAAVEHVGGVVARDHVGEFVAEAVDRASAAQRQVFDIRAEQVGDRRDDAVDAFVGRFRRGRKPTLINATAIQTVGIGVVRMQFDAEARLEKRAWRPGWREPEQAAGAGKFRFDLGFGVSLESFELVDGVHAGVNAIR